MRKVFCKTNKGYAWAYKDDSNDKYKPNVIYKANFPIEMFDEVLEGVSFQRWATSMDA